MKEEPKEPTDKEDGQKVAKKEKEVNEKKEAPPKEDSDEGVTVSEEFQKSAHELTHKATKHELKHLHDKAYTREDELRKEESDKVKEDERPSEFSTEGMPTD